MQFLHCAFRFIDSLHLDECKTFGALIVSITYDLGVLHVSDAVEQLEEIALSGIEREIANVKTRRRDFNPFRFSPRSRGLRAIARLCRHFPFLPAIAEKFGNTLPKRFFL